MGVHVRAIAVVLGLSWLLAPGQLVSADDKVKKDRRNMAMDVGWIVFSTARGNPGGAMLASAKLGLDTYKYQKHKGQALEGQAGATTPSYTGPAESLVPVPQRPGYYCYPSNPDQLYVDPSQASDPMQARIVSVEATATADRITVRIANTAKDGRPLDYAIDGTSFSVAPGSTQTLVVAPGAVISYERGDRPGADRYRLVEGSYEFRSVENGWRFYNTNPGRKVAAGTVASPSATVPAAGPTVPR